MTRDKEFRSGMIPPEGTNEPAWWFAFREESLLVHEDSPSVRILSAVNFSDLGLEASSQHYLGLLDGRRCFAVELPNDATAPEGMVFEGLRQVFEQVDEDLFWVGARAVQIVEWERTHKFCGRCGVPTELQTSERARKCPRCGLLHYPRLSPAVIVLIERGDRVLMARSRRFPSGMFSVLAGFVEPGESLEEAIVREVKEEVGISLRDLRYFGSQPWPFPHSLMIGFTASYAGGEIVIDATELEEAGWFTAGQLPQLPGKISIARKLIDWFIAKNTTSQEAK
jgi:NAD+ diphosphatase